MVKFIARKDNTGEQHTYVLDFSQIRTIDVSDTIEVGYKDMVTFIPYQNQGITRKEMIEKLNEFLSDDEVRFLELWRS